MPYPEKKSENYTNFGGINTRSSKYITDSTQFLNLENVDFTIVGSLSSMWGSTQYAAGQGTSQIVTGLGEGLFLINNTASFTNYIGTTEVLLATGTRNVFQANQSGITNIFSYIFSGFTNFANDLPVDFLPANDLYFCNGNEFLAYRQNGHTIIPYSLPIPINTGPSTINVGNAIGPTLELNATYAFYYAFVRTDGFVGPYGFTAWNPFLASGFTNRASFSISTVPGIAPQFTVPDGSGGSTQLYFGNNLFSTNYFGISGIVAWVNIAGAATYLNYLSIIGNTSRFAVDASLSLFGGTYIFDPQNFYGDFILPSTTPTSLSANVLDSVYYNPTTLELYNNQMFMAGFYDNSNFNPQTVVFSRIGEFEKVDLENFFECRTSDGDPVTSLKAYFTELVIFKYKSIWSLRGDDPDNFNLSQMTDQYGCVSTNANCIFNQRLWFLDQSGICEYNGANTTSVSDEVESIFQTMNQVAAKKVASMLHVKEREEVWCFIPTGENRYCDTCVIYNYLTKSWTTRKNLRNTSASAMVQGIFDRSKPFIGNYSGQIFAMGQSYSMDNGLPFTQVIESRYIATELGHSVEKQFRRFYLDAVTVGNSVPIEVVLTGDQGTGETETFTMYLDKFQNRIDFGIPAKDLNIKLTYSSTHAIRINGFTLEYRYQRAT